MRSARLWGWAQSPTARVLPGLLARCQAWPGTPRMTFSLESRDRVWGGGWVSLGRSAGTEAQTGSETMVYLPVP